MKCPFCGELGDKVVDSRESREGDVIRRRRQCLNDTCRKRFTSYERIDEIPYMVVKKDGTRERFERQKLIGGLLKACEKRPVKVADIEEIADLAEQLLLEKPEREKFLKKIIHQVAHHYDYVLIDLPPSVSLLTINGLMAADEMIIPVQCEYYGLEGLSQILETVDMVNHNLGHNLRIAGALLTMYDSREHLSREVSKSLRKHFVGHVYDVEIPRAVALAEAPSFGKPICFHDPHSPGARAYERLAKELIQQERIRES